VDVLREVPATTTIAVAVVAVRVAPVVQVVLVVVADLAVVAARLKQAAPVASTGKARTLRSGLSCV
jgi:hypothetical protein